jgi:peptide methionine sulfoxide reductase MsrB
VVFVCFVIFVPERAPVARRTSRERYCINGAVLNFTPRE